MVSCLHCGEEFDSYLIEWREEAGDNGSAMGFWCCPTPGCDGKGFGFDIFPIDPDYRDENGDKMWSDDGDGRARTTSSTWTTTTTSPPKTTATSTTFRFKKATLPPCPRNSSSVAVISAGASRCGGAARASMSSPQHAGRSSMNCSARRRTDPVRRAGPCQLAATPAAVETLLYCVGLDRTAGVSMREVYVSGLANVLDVWSR